MEKDAAITPLKYAGFWLRFAAFILDSLLVIIIILPILLKIYGIGYLFSEHIFKGTWDVLLQFVFPGIAFIILWVYRSATPGKEIAGIKIVDAATLQAPTVSQCIIRYLAYYVSLIPLGFGFLAISMDSKKRAWHDRIAKTLVIHKK